MEGFFPSKMNGMSLLNRKVYGIGETIYDIIFKDNQPQASKAGGSTFNAMVSLGRMGVNTSFISKLGDDKVGQIIVAFMKKNNISTENLTIWEGHKTDIALAFLNDKGDAEYSFYKEYDKQFVEARIPEFKKDDLLLFGSYFALNPLLRPLVNSVLKAAKKAKAIIYYDPNFRASHLHQIEELKPLLMENFEAATIVRGSDEDFANIFGVSSPSGLRKEFSSSSSQFIITKNSEGVDVCDGNNDYHFPAKPLVPLSTIGAGDSFNAGFLYALLKFDIGGDQLENMSAELWSQVISTAVAFATDVCQSYENYISEEFAADLKKDTNYI